MDSLKEKMKKVPKWVWIALAVVVVIVFLRMKSGGGVEKIDAQFPGAGESQGGGGSGGSGSIGDMFKSIEDQLAEQQRQWQKEQDAKNKLAQDALNKQNETLRNDVGGMFGDMYDLLQQQTNVAKTTEVPGTTTVQKSTEQVWASGIREDGVYKDASSSTGYKTSAIQTTDGKDSNYYGYVAPPSSGVSNGINPNAIGKAFADAAKNYGSGSSSTVVNGGTKPPPVTTTPPPKSNPVQPPKNSSSGSGSSKPSSGTGSKANETKYLDNLIKTGSAGEKKWAEKEKKKYK